MQDAGGYLSATAGQERTERELAQWARHSQVCLAVRDPAEFHSGIHACCPRPLLLGHLVSAVPCWSGWAGRWDSRPALLSDHAPGSQETCEEFTYWSTWAKWTCGLFCLFTS